MEAIKSNDLEEVTNLLDIKNEELISKGLTTDVNAIFKYDDKVITPLFYAIACYTSENGLEVIQQLLKNKADIDYKEHCTGMAS